MNPPFFDFNADFNEDDDAFILAILKRDTKTREGGSAQSMVNMFLNYSTTLTVANSTTETQVLGAPDAGSTKTVSPGFVSLGRTFELYFAGVMGWTGTPTLNVRPRLGGLTGVLLQNFTPVLSVAGSLGTAWRIYMLATITAVGVGGILVSHPCQFEFVTGGGADGQAIWSGRAANGPTVNLTASPDWALTAQWGTADPANFFTYNFGCVNIVR